MTTIEAYDRLPADHREMANAVRFLAADAVEQAKSGHPGMPMGMADVATILFAEELRFDAADPAWPDRDRFILSAGHGSMLIYALLYLTGVEAVTLDQLKRFRQLGSNTPGHPEFGHTPGVETTTGPLGQGIATAVGMALAEAMLKARFGASLVNHKTWVIAGDGCLAEGISHEAIDMAGHLRLKNLVVLWDDNRISIDGPTSLSTSMDQRRRFEAAGWTTMAIDGHDPAQIRRALARARRAARPVFIACRTTIGFGAPKKAGTEGVHGAPLGPDELQATREALRWPHGPFEIPQAILARWREAGARGRPARLAWERRLARHPQAAAFGAALKGEIEPAARDALAAHARAMAEQKPTVATRKASEMALGAINGASQLTIGGSADLTHSNLTLTKGLAAVQRGDLSGRYIHYGIREHGMAAAMNGIALHGGFIPYGGTFLVFSDYARGAVRLSALMRQRVIYVFTHDSIGLGEDGPTHQPVEHLASLRAMPNLLVMRPADAVETAECWAAALATRGAPSALCLSRQNLPTLRTEAGENLSARGGYVIRPTKGPRDATILATGSEVHLAMQAAEKLAGEGIAAAVVSMPCWELFEAQPTSYRDEVLGVAPRIGVEAALRFGWDRWIGPDGIFIGMQGFGESAPGPDLYRHFGVTAEAVADAVREAMLKQRKAA